MTFHFGQLIAHLVQDAQRARRLDRRQRHGQQQGLGARLLVHRREAGDRDDRGRRAEDAVHAVRRHDPDRDEGRPTAHESSARSSRRSRRWRAVRRPRMRASELPRHALKFATVWLLLGAVVFVGFQWRQREAQQATLHASRAASIEIRRGADGHYHWPGTLNGQRGRLPGRHRRHRRRDPGRAGRASSACAAKAGALEHRRRRASTGQRRARRPRARGRRARRAAAHGRAAARWTRRCSAWTCSAGCAGSSATARCASTSARRLGPR